MPDDRKLEASIAMRLYVTERITKDEFVQLEEFEAAAYERGLHDGWARIPRSDAAAKRKVVSITTMGNILYAVADDNTMWWKLSGNPWKQIEPLPQEDA